MTPTLAPPTQAISALARPDGAASAAAMSAPVAAESAYLQYLPSIYRQDAVLRQVLRIFEAVMVPLERVVDALPLYTDPAMAPDEFLPWLAHWVGVALDGDWPIERRRALIADAVEIHRWRGTRRGLTLHLRAYTGTEPLIQEHYEGFVLSPESGLGWNTHLTPAVRNPVLFVITVPVPEPRRVDPMVLRAIVEADKPAHTSYRLRVVRCTAGPAAGPARSTRGWAP